MAVSRRSFLTSAAFAAAASAIPPRSLYASPLAPLIGLQLYSLRAQFGKDGFEDAVARIGRIEQTLGFADLGQFTAPPAKA